MVAEGERRLEDIFDRALAGGGIGGEMAGLPAADRDSLGKALSGLALLRRQLALTEEEAAPAPPIDPLAGRLEIGGYRIIEMIGAGGMGMVYRAWQETLRREVALKLLPLQFLVRPDTRERFVAEARVASRLRHPNIVAVHSLEEIEGFLFFTMEYLPGISLANLIASLRSSTVPGLLASMIPAVPDAGPRPAGERDREIAEALGVPYCRFAAGLIRDLAGAVGYAHGAGVIHRDIKPGNIIVDATGKPWLCDFGLAKDLIAAESRTASEDILGTAAYIAPEKLEEGADRNDPRADIYGLSLCLYEMVTLRQPFLAATPHATLGRVAKGELPAPRRLNRSIPRELEMVILRGLERDPARRYTTAGDLAEDLARFLAGQPVRAARGSMGRRARLFVRRHRRAVGLAAIGLLAAILLGPGLVHRVGSWKIEEEAAAAVDRLDREYLAGNWKEALALADGVRRLAEAAGDPELKARAFSRIGEIEVHLDGNDPSKGIADLGQTMVEAERTSAGRLAHLEILEGALLRGRADEVESQIGPIAVSPGSLEGEAAFRAAILRARAFFAAGGVNRAKAVLSPYREVEDPTHLRKQADVLAKIVDVPPLLRVIKLPKTADEFQWIGTGQLDGAGPQEVVVLRPGSLEVWSADGPAEKPIASAVFEGPGKARTGLVADLDGDGRGEVLVGFDSKGLRVEVWKLGKGALLCLARANFTYGETDVYSLAPMPAISPWGLVVAFQGERNGLELMAWDEDLRPFDGWTVEGKMVRGAAGGSDPAPSNEHISSVRAADFGDPTPAIIRTAGGYGPGAYGVQVFTFDPVGRRYVSAGSDLLAPFNWSLENPSYCCVESCEAIEAPDAGSQALIIIGRGGNPLHTYTGESPTYAYGGLASYEWIKEDGRLQRTPFRHLGEGISVHSLRVADVVPAAPGAEVVAIVTDGTAFRERPVIFFRTKWPPGWFLPLFGPDAAADTLRLAVGDVYGDGGEEVVIGRKNASELLVYDFGNEP